MRPASVSGDNRRYTIKASELHLPIALIRWVGTPARAAVVAALILKLCPVYTSVFTPLEDKAARTPATKVALETGVPSEEIKRGPGPAGQTFR